MIQYKDLYDIVQVLVLLMEHNMGEGGYRNGVSGMGFVAVLRLYRG
jgi:hypothetical protein